MTTPPRADAWWADLGRRLEHAANIFAEVVPSRKKWRHRLACRAASRIFRRAAKEALQVSMTLTQAGYDDHEKT